MNTPEQTGKPITLEEAISMVPPAYEVFMTRVGNNGGVRFHLERNQNGGKFTLFSKTFPTWQEAFNDVWSKL